MSTDEATDSQMSVSSAYWKRCECSMYLNIVRTTNANKVGDRIPSCGTPDDTNSYSDITSLYDTACRLLLK